LWKVSDADNHVYLLGSFHALKPSDYPLAHSVDVAFADAERVVFEISPEEMKSPELPQKLMAAAALSNGMTLQQSLSERSWHRLQLYAQKRGLPLENYQALEPWFVALVISMKEIALIGYDPKLGLDQYLMGKVASSGKQTGGLESTDQQIAALDSMTSVEQQQSISEALDDADNFKAKMDQMHDLWREGNVQALDQMLAADFKRNYASLYQRVNVDRNRAWMVKIRRMLDDEAKDDTLVVVGSMHLLGSDGLVRQLRSQGYRVDRL
jgi:uncharacterized protein YbaP (TraB family)